MRRALARAAAERSAVRGRSGTCNSWMRNIVVETRERHAELGIWRWLDDDNHHLLSQAPLCPIGLGHRDSRRRRVTTDAARDR
eukprot:scaffold87339_cov54-Phaeocystis_antarctica.AAC.1